CWGPERKLAAQKSLDGRQRMTKQPSPQGKISSPKGLDLNPRPTGAGQLSKKAGVAVVILGMVLMTAVYYGLRTRMGVQKQPQAAAGGQEKVEPARPPAEFRSADDAQNPATPPMLTAPGSPPSQYPPAREQSLPSGASIPAPPKPVI